MSLSWQHCTHLYYSPLSLCLTAAAHVTHLSTRTHTYRNIWTTANQRGGPPFTISDWFRPRYKPNGSVFCWVSESRILFFLFSNGWTHQCVLGFCLVRNPWEIRFARATNWSHSRALYYACSCVCLGETEPAAYNISTSTLRKHVEVT